MKQYFEHEHLVTLGDTNLVGNVYFVNYLAWQGECRERFLAEQAPGVLAALTGDLALVTVSCGCSFLRELYAMDLVSIRMSLGGIHDGHITMEFDYYRVNRGPSELVARGTQVVACMTRRGGDLFPVAVPAELERALDRYAGTAAARHPASHLALVRQHGHY